MSRTPPTGVSRSVLPHNRALLPLRHHKNGALSHALRQGPLTDITTQVRKVRCRVKRDECWPEGPPRKPQVADPPHRTARPSLRPRPASPSRTSSISSKTSSSPSSAAGSAQARRQYSPRDEPPCAGPHADARALLSALRVRKGATAPHEAVRAL